MTCFQCDSPGLLHQHHVIPRSLGGTRTVPLCEDCHGVVHGKDLRISALTRDALAAKKDRGERTGSVPYGYTLADDGVSLVELPEEQAIIAIARKCAAAGFEPSMIARGLHRRGWRSRTGRKFTSTQVRRLLNHAPT